MCAAESRGGAEMVEETVFKMSQGRWSSGVGGDVLPKYVDHLQEVYNCFSRGGRHETRTGGKGSTL